MHTWIDNSLPHITNSTQDVDGIFIMKITHHLTRVGILGSETLALGECASDLNQTGYDLNFSSSSNSRDEVEYDDDNFYCRHV
jgi:hypothetical protein